MTAALSNLEQKLMILATASFFLFFLSNFEF